MNQSPSILITGASGRIGRMLTAHWNGRYPLRLMDVAPLPGAADDRFTRASITDLEQIINLSQGIETVVHLAADSSIHAVWESLLPRNIIGVYNVLEAAVRADCRRVIFASSVNAVRGHPPGVEITTSMPVAPGNLYGASKAWGEAVGRFYADYRGISVICLRLGWVVPRDHPDIRPGSQLLPLLLTYRDAARLFEAALSAPGTLRFGMFNGSSDNRHKRLNIDAARNVLGYTPQDDAYDLARIPNA
jgi:uronate dehydrogenase